MKKTQRSYRKSDYQNRCVRIRRNIEGRASGAPPTASVQSTSFGSGSPEHYLRISTFSSNSPRSPARCFSSFSSIFHPLFHRRLPYRVHVQAGQRRLEFQAVGNSFCK